MRHAGRCMAALCATLLCADALGGQFAPERRLEVLREGLQSFDRAVDVQPRDAAAARDLYRTAAADFGALLGDGVRNAGLEFNLANTHFRLGELGPAILHYRRAERIAPADADVAANLEFVRNRVEPAIADEDAQRVRRGLLFWHDRTSLPGRAGFAAICGALGWALLLLRLRWRSAPVLALGVAGALLAAVAGGSALYQMNAERARPEAVLLSGDHILRQGRGAGYDPVLAQPLGPGVEVRVLDEQSDWMQVRLRDGRTGWIESKAVERV